MKIRLPVALLFLFGCAFLNMSEFTITEWTPDKLYYENPSEINAVISFSSKPDPRLTESAFSLTENNQMLKGKISFNGNSMSFTPDKPFESGRDYVMSVNTSAEDEWGVSLDKTFYLKFSTKAERDAPQILSFSPGIDAIISDLYEPIIIKFSEAVNKSSFFKAFSLTPQVQGVFSWNDSGDEISFVPINPYGVSLDYKGKITTELVDLQENPLMKTYEFSFSSKNDIDRPYLLSIENDIKTVALLEDLVSDGQETINENWRRDWDLLLTFSEELDRASMESAFDLSPNIDFEIEWISDMEALVEIEDKSIIWDQKYAVFLGPGIKDKSGNKNENSRVFYLLTNSETSRPPIINNIYFVSEDGPVYSELENFKVVDLSLYDAARDSFLDFFILPGEGWEIDIFSFMTALTISTTNTCSSIVPQYCRIYTADNPPGPLPMRQLSDGENLIRLHATVSNNPANRGLIVVSLNPDLKDTGGNFLEDVFKITAVK